MCTNGDTFCTVTNQCTEQFWSNSKWYKSAQTAEAHYKLKWWGPEGDTCVVITWSSAHRQEVGSWGRRICFLSFRAQSLASLSSVITTKPSLHLSELRLQIEAVTCGRMLGGNQPGQLWVLLMLCDCFGFVGVRSSRDFWSFRRQITPQYFSSIQLHSFAFPIRLVSLALIELLR